MAYRFGHRLATRFATLAAGAAIACAFAGTTSAAYAADSPTPLDPDATPQQQYYLYGPEVGGANVLAAWQILENTGVSTDTKVDVAVLDTGVYMMRSTDSIEEYREANGTLNPALFHQEFNLDNLDTAHSGAARLARRHRPMSSFPKPQAARPIPAEPPATPPTHPARSRASSPTPTRASTTRQATPWFRFLAAVPTNTASKPQSTPTARWK